MQPFITTNENEITRLEGLYIKERTPPAVLSGVNLSVVGIVGETVRGPVDRAIEINSEARFRAVFGWRDQGSGGSVVSKVWQAMANKTWGKLIIVRACAAAAATATVSFSSVLRVDAANPGTWANNATANIVDATDGDSNKFDCKITYLGNTYWFRNLNISGSNDNLSTVVGTDDGTPFRLTKLGSGRPSNASTALSGGTQGSIADSDFTASGRGINVLSAYKGIGVQFIAERSSSTLRAKIATDAAAATDRLFLMCPNDETVSVSSAITDVASYRSDRIIYCYNAPYTLDGEAGAEMVTHPTAWMAAVLSQIDVDIHPGEEDTKKFLAPITKLYNEALTREDYISLKEAGICALERDDGYCFVSGVTTSLTQQYTQITRRRMADYLILSLGKGLKNQVKKKNTFSRRRGIVAMINAFLGNLQKAERVVEEFKVDGEALNTVQGRAIGKEAILVQVKTLGHILHLVLEPEIGTTVEIKQAAA